LITQPAERIKKVPSTNKDIRNKSGLPAVKIKKDDNVGHNKSVVPIGLSALISLKKLKILCVLNISG
jgi:hypothetical protein